MADPKIEHKSIRMPFYKDGATVDGNTVRQIFSVAGVVDDGLDVIHLGAFAKTLQENADRVKCLWSHNMMEPPIGTVANLKEIMRNDLPPEIQSKFPDATGGLYGEVTYLPTPRGQEVLTGIKAGAITENSIGYDPIKFDFEESADGWPVRNLRELKLWDVSPVTFGMNPATGNYKVAVPYKDTGKADEGMAWSKPSMMDFTDKMWGDCSDADKRRIAGHYAWADAMPPESFGGCKLPHHEASKTGIGPAVWKGVSAAMARLMQAGTDIPDGDRKAVYEHLSKHYAQFDKTPPDFKFVDFAARLNAAFAIVNTSDEWLKSGRVLSAANIEKLRGALSLISELLSSAEPQPDPVEDSPKRRDVVRAQAQALTDSMKLRLQIAERSLKL